MIHLQFTTTTLSKEDQTDSFQHLSSRLGLIYTRIPVKSRGGISSLRRQWWSIVLPAVASTNFTVPTRSLCLADAISQWTAVSVYRPVSEAGHLNGRWVDCESRVHGLHFREWTVVIVVVGSKNILLIASLTHSVFKVGLLGAGGVKSSDDSQAQHHCCQMFICHTYKISCSECSEQRCCAAEANQSPGF